MCAGSIHTPQIMQLSGFGPRDQLSEMGVDVKADLPGVGQNMIVSAPLCTSGSHAPARTVSSLRQSPMHWEPAALDKSSCAVKGAPCDATSRLMRHMCPAMRPYIPGNLSANQKTSLQQADRCLPLQDHPAVLSAFYLKEEAGPISVTDELMHSDGRIRLRAIMKYLLFKKGPLTTTGCDHGAFVSTKGEQ